MTHAIKLSDHFSWEEAETTQHRNLDNSIPTSLIAPVLHTATKMELVRNLLDNKPIHINSWYRSPAVNEAVGGSKSSQHSKGEAVDFVCPGYGSPIMIVKKLQQAVDLLNFDQLIYEHTWVHISFVSNPSARARRQVLTLLNNKKYAVGITDKRGVPQ